MSDTEQNKQLATAWLDYIGDSDLAAMLRSTADGWQLHGGWPGLPTGPAGVRAMVAHLSGVQQKWTVDDVIAEGDRVVVRATNNCEQNEFLGVPAAGIRQVFTATLTFRIVDGIVHEIWRNADDLGRLIQLGAVINVPDAH